MFFQGRGRLLFRHFQARGTCTCSSYGEDFWGNLRIWFRYESLRWREPELRRSMGHEIRSLVLLEQAQKAKTKVKSSGWWQAKAKAKRGCMSERETEMEKQKIKRVTQQKNSQKGRIVYEKEVSAKTWIKLFTLNKQWMTWSNWVSESIIQTQCVWCCDGMSHCIVSRQKGSKVPGCFKDCWRHDPGWTSSIPGVFSTEPGLASTFRAEGCRQTPAAV